MRNFIHSGDLGDVIYSLPTVRALGGGTLHLCERRGVSMHGMSIYRYNWIEPLLRLQPYLRDVRFDDIYEKNEPAGCVDLNAFRWMGFDLHSQNLADIYLIANGLPTHHRETPWLRADRNFHESVVISRSARYHNPQFNWRDILDRFGRNAIFVGTPAEHVAFVTEFGSIPHAYTRTLLEAAGIINAADVFIGNQSCPLAIAHGLGKRVLIEVCPYCPNCIFKRPGEFTEYTDAFSITGPEAMDAREQTGDGRRVGSRYPQERKTAAAQDEEALVAWAGEGGAEAGVP